MSVSWSCGCAVVLIPEDIYIAGELVVLAVGAFGTDYIVINTRRHKFSFVLSIPTLRWVVEMAHLQTPSVKYGAFEADYGFV